MTTAQLIALNSPVMGSGKSEVAGRLVDKHGFVLVKFAGPLKVMASAFLGHLGYDKADLEMMLEGDRKEAEIPRIGVSTRHILQTLGTEWGREAISADLWAGMGYERIRALLRKGQSVVVDDLRYLNELAIILLLKGEAHRVVRPGLPAYNKHPSEGALDNLPLPEVWNGGSLAHLHELADGLVKREAN